jgi:hypothetical protein
VKQILQPIEVMSPFTPVWQFRWKARSYQVMSVLERWYYRGKWWLDSALEGEHRDYFRVVCKPVMTPAGKVQMRPGPYSSTLVSRTPAVLGPERVMEIFQRRQGRKQDWVLSKVVD